MGREGSGPERRLAALGLELPALRPRAGLYEGWVSAGDLLFLSGQGADDWVGRLGADLTVEQGRAAARDCALNLLAQVGFAVELELVIRRDLRREWSVAEVFDS